MKGRAGRHASASFRSCSGNGLHSIALLAQQWTKQESASCNGNALHSLPSLTRGFEFSCIQKEGEKKNTILKTYHFSKMRLEENQLYFAALPSLAFDVLSFFFFCCWCYCCFGFFFFFSSTQNSGDEACIKVEDYKKVTVVYACMVCLSKGCCFCVKHLVLVK